jgi:Fatty acid cis/trans isomerase (CTI).
MASDLPADFYSRKVQPLFDSRCIACHSCLNAPCQLNLQNYEGFQRGANKVNVYNGGRIDATEPTRLWLDAHTTQEWRRKNFFEVNTSKEPAKNLFFQTIIEKAQESEVPTKTVIESQYCAANSEEKKIGMPYALPALTSEDVLTLQTWIADGAKGPSSKEEDKFRYIEPVVEKQIRGWEEYFNRRELRQQLVSRYLYEHLFLAHLRFEEKPTEFFRLVRSTRECAKGVQEVTSRRPNDSPGVDRFYYCFTKYPGTVVAKNHIPYLLTEAKKKRFEELFFGTEWELKQLPTYEYKVAENPLLTFAAIPAKARYQFLLDDAQYHITTFIKGPVCNGSNAVNSIQEQFYVFFINPDSEIMTKSPGFQDSAQVQLVLPGMWGSDVKLDQTAEFTDTLVKSREAYRKSRAQWKKEFFPQGYSLNDIWDGGGENPNAILTVMRHYDNAVVVHGAVGDLAKTTFVLDYPLFERLVYNLVVNFDVFGNISHQLLTRVYMDMIRMEAEEIFLSFLPAKDRIPLRKSWYQGLVTEMKMDYMFPVLNQDIPTAIKFSSKNTKKEFIEKVLFTRMNEKVRGKIDALNWKNIEVPKTLQSEMKLSGIEEQLSRLTAIPAKQAPFSKFFPDISFIMITGKDGNHKVYSIIHNREHQNVSWILNESLRLAPEEDTLIIQEGYRGGYPNMFFTLNQYQVKGFVEQVLKIKKQKEYDLLLRSYGVIRSQQHFWRVYDQMNAQFKKDSPIDFGFLDLTRYEMTF